MSQSVAAGSACALKGETLKQLRNQVRKLFSVLLKPTSKLSGFPPNRKARRIRNKVLMSKYLNLSHRVIAKLRITMRKRTFLLSLQTSRKRAITSLRRPIVAMLLPKSN